jgi:hypothetical protein
MIYFDRIEVVNILSASSGKYLQIFVTLNSYYMYTESWLLSFVWFWYLENVWGYKLDGMGLEWKFSVIYFTL